MTTKSERRAAEMAVIDAAVAHIDYTVVPGRYPKQLSAAVAKYKALRLEKAGEAAIPNDGPDTSIQAGQSLKNLGKMAQQVFDEILVTTPAGPGVSAGGITVDQIEQTLNRSHQSVSARVNELRNKGWVVDSGRKRLTRSKRSAIIWIPTQAGRSQRHV